MNRGRHMSYDPGFAGHWGGLHAIDRRDFREMLEVRREPIDRDGYIRSGRYFGTGKPLFHVADEYGEVDFYIRAESLVDAEAIVAGGYPRAIVVGKAR